MKTKLKRTVKNAGLMLNHMKFSESGLAACYADERFYVHI